MGATDTAGRVLASLGKQGPVQPKFVAGSDVPNAGVLLALPSLSGTGLLRVGAKYFDLPRGYYGLASILILLVFLALARVKSLEGLRYCSPGEWGKILGLDRVPEVRTLREKLRILSGDGRAEKWSAELCREWMRCDPEATGLLYVDGHVRIYHGSSAKLPLRYVSRQRLCLRGTTDYWINALDAKPFFVVTKPIDPGLVQVLTNDIVPRLTQDAPELVGAEALADSPRLHRFTLVFDREGYSPVLFANMKKQRIACLTYRRSAGSDWPLSEFHTESVTLSNGETVEMSLAERGVHLQHGNLWAREIRRRTKSGHQTPIIATDYLSDRRKLAAAMFGRWSQENFFRYMLQHFGLDRLVTHAIEEIPDTIPVVNPAHRKLDSAIRGANAKLARRRAKFAALDLAEPIKPKVVRRWERRKADLLQEIEELQREIAELKPKRKATPRHILVKELSEEDRITQLHAASKHFIDTIKMVAYRAETAMAHVLQDQMSRRDDARTLLRALYTNEADLIPDHQSQTLTVRLHSLANRASEDAVRHLCRELTATETIFPDTDLRLVYELGSC